LSIYLPILRCKKGELKALKELSSETCKLVKPVLAIQAVPQVWDAKKQKKSLAKHLSDTAKSIADHLPEGMRPFIDFEFTGNELCDGVHYAKFFFGELDDWGVKFDVVSGLDRASDSDLQKVLKDRVVRKKSKLCIRIYRDEAEIIETQHDEIDELLTFFGVTVADPIFLLDAKSVEEKELDQLEEILSACIQAFSDLGCRNIAVAGAAMPINLMHFKSNGIAEHRRCDFVLWSRLRKKFATDRILFADYGIVNPMTPEIDPRIMTRSPRIRYTVENAWQIFKGESAKKVLDRIQTPILSSRVIGHSCYLGANYSWGDKYIKDCAAKKQTGSPTTWVSVDTNHHIEFVSKQIAKLVDE
jgi:hypothetical protein